MAIGSPARSAAARSRGKGDSVVAAEGHQFAAGGRQVQRVLLDGFDGFVDVERVDRHVPGIGHLDVFERAYVPRRVVGAQEAAGFADVVCAEAGSRAVGDAGVEGHAHHGDVGSIHLVKARKAGVGGSPGVPGNTG
jgi:hypothetical protein